MTKWGTLMKVEKTEREVLRDYLKYTIIQLLAIASLIVFGAALINLAVNKTAVILVTMITTAVVEYLTMSWYEHKIQIHMRKLHNYLDVGFSIKEKRDYDLVGFQNFDTGKEELLDDILEHIPSIY